MPIATYKDVCVDAVDAPALGRFWTGALLADPDGNEFCAFVV